MRVRRQRGRELADAKRARQIVDEGGRRREERIEAILNGAVRAMAIARWVFPRPGLPARISERPSVTKSAASAEPSMWSRNDD